MLAYVTQTNIHTFNPVESNHRDVPAGHKKQDIYRKYDPYDCFVLLSLIMADFLMSETQQSIIIISLSLLLILV